MCRTCTFVKTVIYGTRITPTIAKNIIGSFPNDRSVFDAETTSYVDVQRNGANSTLVGRYPSISTVLGCTQSQKALYLWQIKMIKQLGGVVAFRKFMRERVECGRSYHRCIHKLLLECQSGGNVKDIYHRFLETLDDSVSGYIRSTSQIIMSLNATKEMRLEKYAAHHRLFYYGRFDALIRYKDALFLVDWKTASCSSTKDRYNNQLSSLYNDPLQIAAYVGAVNSDSNYSDIPVINNGAIVIAKENGECAQVVEMNCYELKIYWEKWLDCLKNFWTELDRRHSHSGLVSFVYKNV